jgi:large subunit ribosomal protein L6
MSRIGKQVIKLPAQVNITLTEEKIAIKGPKGEVDHLIPACLSIAFKEDGVLQISRKEETRQAREIHGLFRSLLANSINGSATPFTKTLELKGVGYKANVEKGNLILSVGYTHPITIIPPTSITITVESNTTINVTGINKEKVGLIAQQIRATRPPEPYKGKGVLYKGEVIQRKVGKSSK